MQVDRSRIGSSHPVNREGHMRAIWMQVDRPIESAADYEIVTGIVQGMVDRFKAPLAIMDFHVSVQMWTC